MELRPKKPGPKIDYCLFVACKVKNSNNIIIYDIAQDNKDERIDLRRQITFYKTDTRKMRVKISEDFNSVVLVNHDEYYLLRKVKV